MKHFRIQLPADEGSFASILSTLKPPMIRFSDQNRNISGNTSQCRQRTPKTGTRLAKMRAITDGCRQSMSRKCLIGLIEAVAMARKKQLPFRIQPIPTAIESHSFFGRLELGPWT